MVLELEINSSAVRSSTTARCSPLDHWLRAVPRRTNAAPAGVDGGARDAEADQQIYGLPEKAPRCWCRTPVVAEACFGAVVKDRGSKLGRTTHTEK